MSLKKIISQNKYFFDVIAGIVSGINIIFSSLSYAAIILPGSLQSYLSQGFLIFLLSTLVPTAIFLIFSKIPINISAPPSQVVAILAILSVQVSLPLISVLKPNQIVPIIFFSISITTIIMGTIFFLLGYFHLGNLIRYLPYSVSSGFLGGSGWLLVKSAAIMLLSVPIGHSISLHLLSSEQIFSLILASSWAIIMYILIKRYQNPLILPIVLILSILFFYGFLAIKDISIKQATELGLMYPKPSLSHTVNWFAFFSLTMLQKNYHLILSIFKDILVIIFISGITFLFNVSALEVSEGKGEIDSNKELRLAGIVNIIIGFFGWFVSFISLINTLINEKSGAKTKFSAIVMLFCLLAAAVFGLSLVIYFPKIILGALLLYYGLSLVFDMLISNWVKVSFTEFMLSALILLEIIFFGLLSGITVGIILATIVFAYNYSRINVIKFILQGDALQSKTRRSYEIHQALKKKSNQIVFIKLHEFIFFGTGSKLLDQIKKLLVVQEPEPLKYLILDFSLVSGVDASAMSFIYQIKEICELNKTFLLFTNLSNGFLKKFSHWKIFDKTNPYAKRITNNDLALEWCENKIIKSDSSLKLKSEKLDEQLEKLMPEIDVNQFMKYLEPVYVKKGNFLFYQGDIARDLYFIESGEVAVLIKIKMEVEKTLRKIGPGNTVGAMGVYTKKPRVASVFMTKDSVLYKLSEDSLELMRTKDFQLVEALDRFIINLLSERLEFLDKQLKILL